MRQNQLHDPGAEELHVGVQPQQVRLHTQRVDKEFVPQAGDARTACGLDRDVGVVTGAAVRGVGARV